MRAAEVESGPKLTTVERNGTKRNRIKGFATPAHSYEANQGHHQGRLAHRVRVGGVPNETTPAPFSVSRLGVNRAKQGQLGPVLTPPVVPAQRRRKVASSTLSSYRRGALADAAGWNALLSSLRTGGGPEAGGCVMDAFPRCQACDEGELVPLSDFGSQGAPIHYKAWVCTNPDCGFNIKIRNGDVLINEPITDAANTSRVR